MLAHFSATDLTRLCLVNRRFGSLVCRLLHRRLLAVASLPADDLIFECFTPAAKLSTPSLDCRYVATKTRRPGDSGVELFEPAEDESPSLDSLGRMYSVFRPVVSNDNRRPRRREDGPAAAEDEDEDEDEDDTATELAHLDADQLFEQLCAVTNVVKPGPRPGLFLSHVNISDGVLRLWRDWLADMADDGSNARHKILWVDAGQTIGLRMRVTHGPAGRMPVLSGPDDYPPISYRLEYQGAFPGRCLDTSLSFSLSPHKKERGTRETHTDTAICHFRALCSHRRPSLGCREVGYAGSLPLRESDRHCIM